MNKQGFVSWVKFTIVLEALRIVPMYCLHHVGWIRGVFTHSSLPSQFFLVSVRWPLNQHDLFPIPGLGHTKRVPVRFVGAMRQGFPSC